MNQLIWLCRVLVAALGVFHLCSGMQTLSCGMWNLVPWPGMEPGPPTLRTWRLSHWTTRGVPRMEIWSGQEVQWPLLYANEPILVCLLTWIERTDRAGWCCPVAPPLREDGVNCGWASAKSVLSWQLLCLLPERERLRWRKFWGQSCWYRSRWVMRVKGPKEPRCVAKRECREHRHERVCQGHQQLVWGTVSTSQQVRTS